jgi:hypothetical protein
VYLHNEVGAGLNLDGECIFWREHKDALFPVSAAGGIVRRALCCRGKLG